jgi:plasmid stabilization system protein ParE
MEKSGLASVRAALTIKQSLSLLEAAPEIGRPVPERLGLRELIIPFGASGYVALYRYDPETDVATILSFRHQKEAGY